MSLTAEGRRLSLRHRDAQMAIRAAGIRDLQRLWPTVSPTNLATTIHPFTDAGATIVSARFTQSAQTASKYYIDYRVVEGVRGGLFVALPQPPPRQVIVDQLRGSSLSGIVNARRAGFSTQAAMGNGFVKASGAASSLILSGGREVVMRAAAADPQATGRYFRIPEPNACAYCLELAAQLQDVTFSTEGRAEFKAHTHCACLAEPEFRQSA